MAVVHVGVLILILLFTLGLFTRVTSVLVWLAAVRYIHRTQQVLFGMDTMMNILLVLPDDREQRGGPVARPADRPLPGGAGEPAALRARSTRRRGRSWRTRRRR